MKFNIGVWYTVPGEDSEEFKEIKISLTETEYMILAKSNRWPKDYTAFAGTYGDCVEFITKHFPHMKEMSDNEYRGKLYEELKSDIKFLETGSHSKDWEIAEHIKGYLQV